MSDLRKAERVIEAVAKRFSATWEASGRDSPAAYLSIEDRRIACGTGFPYFETYRQVFSQLAVPTDFMKVLLVLPGGRVEILSD